MSATVPLDRTRPVTTLTLKALKDDGKRIVMLTAYDISSARLVDAAGVDVILVGDSLGMTVLGHDTTLPVTLDDMIHHTRAVVRGTKRAMVVADMPFMTFQITAEEALRNAGRLIAETGAAAVKVEGGATVADTVRRIVDAGIPVMGHVGLTPQSVHAMGGFRVQAKEAGTALRLIEDCRALQDAGAFAVVLECIPAEVARIVSADIAIPTIGIGAGEGCDGQVQVYHDLLGLGGEFTPKHAKRYAEIGEAIRAAVLAYAEDVRDGAFPGDAQTSHVDAAVVSEIQHVVGGSLRAVAGGREGTT